MSLLSAFNQHFSDFVADIKNVFPDDADVAALGPFIDGMRKTNPRLLLLTFHEHVVVPYGHQILDGDIEFFLEKDYTKDVGDATYVLEKINRFKKPISTLPQSEMDKVVKYMQNLVRLAQNYMA